MFLKLSELSLGCRACFSNNPYIPLIGVGYFGVVVALAFLFPSFPNRHLARGGLIGAVLLALVLTYLNLPSWCAVCLVAHACHIAIWAIWLSFPPKKAPSLHFMVRFSLLFIVPISLTFMAYGFKPQTKIGLHKGDAVPLAVIRTADDRSLALNETVVLNFVAPDCPYCKEQLQMLRERPDRIINISPVLTPELIQHFPTADWVEDKEGRLQKLFKVQGFPTLYLIENEKIKRVVLGVPDNMQGVSFKADLAQKHPFLRKN